MRRLLSYFMFCSLPGTHFYHFGIHFGVTFASLAPLLEHFGYIFRTKKRPEAPEVSPEVPKGDFPSKSSLFETPFGSLFCRFIAFSHEIIMFFHCVFKALFLSNFLCVFEQVGTVKTIKNTAQGTKNSECRKSKKMVQGQVWDGFWSHFWGPVGDKCGFFVEKMSARKQAGKRYPRKVKQVETVMSQGSLTAPVKSKIVWVINNNWTRSNNNKQQVNKNTNNCRVVASVRLLLCLFLVRFLLQTDVVSVSCSILNVVAELMIWHALSKARRI